MPKTFTMEVVATLEYFKMQSELDLERRDPPYALRSKWRELEGKTRSLGLFDSVKVNDSAWRSIRCFVFDEEPALLLIPKVERREEPKPSLFENWNPEDFFSYLIKKTESVPTLSSTEFLTLTHGLLFLKQSSVTPKMRRDHVAVKKVWENIHPLLARLHFLEEFSKEKILKDRIKLFIENHL